MNVFYHLCDTKFYFRFECAKNVYSRERKSRGPRSSPSSLKLRRRGTLPSFWAAEAAEAAAEAAPPADTQTNGPKFNDPS